MGFKTMGGFNTNSVARMRRGAVVVALLIAGLVAPVHSAAAATSAVSGTGVLARPDTPPGEVRQAKAKAPTLRAVRPSKGAFTGGQKVTLKGKRLSGATKVTFGSRAAKILSRRSTTVVVRAPLGVLGKVPVRVRTRHGQRRAAQRLSPTPRSSGSAAPP
jgi:hypothetical protein